MLKYLILDMGKVLVGPVTGNWLITNEFLKNVDINKIDKNDLEKAVEESRYILDGQAKNLDEEYEIFDKFYRSVFEKINYDIPKENFQNIVNNFVYDKEDTKYILYKNVKEDLEKLSKKYTILMLSDNWPCAFNYLKKYDIYKYFTKIYISSVYGERKQDKVFFDYPINDFNIKEGEALFIDDNEDLLDIAVEKGLQVLHMDRNRTLTKSKYKIIYDFGELLD